MVIVENEVLGMVEGALWPSERQNFRDGATIRLVKARIKIAR